LTINSSSLTANSSPLTIEISVLDYHNHPQVCPFILILDILIWNNFHINF